MRIFRFLAIIISICAANALAATAPQIITDPVGTVAIKLSKTDPNVIEMPLPIISKHFSSEKGLQVETIEHRAIVKFLPSMKQKFEVVNNQKTPIGEPEMDYSQIKPSELILILADNSIYTFKLIPTDTDLKTVIIRSTAANLKDAIAYETQSPYEATLSKLAKDAFSGVTPNGYRVNEVGKKWRITANGASMTITLDKTYKGALYDIHLIRIYNRDDSERRYDPQLLFSFAEKINQFPVKAVSLYYGNYAHAALPKTYAQAVIITAGGDNVR